MNYEVFGKLPSGEIIGKYTVDNSECSLSVISFGAITQAFSVNGRDVVGGFDTIDGYLADDSHQGGTIGRVANRIGGAEFSIDGKQYTLPRNDGGNCLHGGSGFDRRIWDVIEHSDSRIVLSYTSRDGEEGFPAELKVTVTYTLLECGFSIDYTAIPSGKTPIALTNHSYFNLDGFGGTIENHTITINADTYTAIDDELIPTGIRPSVGGTPFDLRKKRVIGECFSDTFTGFDHNFNLSSTESTVICGRSVSLAAVLEGSDLKMSVYTDQPGIQFYTGNFLGSGPDFKGGVKQVYHGALCLETQTEPNCVKKGIGIYGKGERYTHFTAYAIEKK